VVSPDPYCSFCSQPGDDLVRLRPVTDDITELPDSVVGLQGAEHRF
jgi:hypothetical protein